MKENKVCMCSNEDVWNNSDVAKNCPEHGAKTGIEYNIPVKIKLFEGGKMPIKATKGAAAYDCFARSCDMLNYIGEIEDDDEMIPEDIVMFRYNLGFALELPEGYCAKIIPRSSVISKALRLSNNIGLIDSDYRGEVSAVFDITSNEEGEFYESGDRVCQLLIEKVEPTTLIEVDELSETKRGTGGYGSTGR